ncbi:MAG: hypothetical protein ABI634_17245 [Acidobacteriota bacterium]
MTRRGLITFGATAALLATTVPPAFAEQGRLRGAVVAAAAAQGGAVAPGQAAPRRAGRPSAPPDGVTAAQAEQMFDQFVIRQARVALQLGPGQIVPFGRRLEQLQMARRRGQRRRQQLLNELNQISRGAEPADEVTLAAKLKALDDLSASVDQEVRDAYARVEETLDTRQRVRFRIFEQRMERQKLDLMARARGAARGQGLDAPAPEAGQ